MRRINRLNYKDLIEKNKEELMSDQKAFDKLKEKLDDKIEERMISQFKKLV